MKNKTVIEISHKTILFIFLMIAAAGILWKAGGVVLTIFISFLIMTALNPIVSAFQKIKVPRGVSAMILLTLILVSLASGVAVLIPPAVEQTTLLLSRLPILLRDSGIDNFDFSMLSSQLGAIPGDALKVISGVFDNVVGIFAILVISYYLLKERTKLARPLSFLMGRDEKTMEEALSAIENKLGGWIRGQILLCAIVGSMEYIGLVGLNIPYALPLAIIGGILEAIPNLGPTLSMVPAAIVGFTMGWMPGAGVVALYFIIQQLENNFIVPQIMKRVVGLNPLTTLISLMVGFKLGGIIGAVLAIPIVLTMRIAFPILKGRYKNIED